MGGGTRADDDIVRGDNGHAAGAVGEGEVDDLGLVVRKAAEGGDAVDQLHGQWSALQGGGAVAASDSHGAGAVGGDDVVVEVFLDHHRLRREGHPCGRGCRRRGGEDQLGGDV